MKKKPTSKTKRHARSQGAAPCSALDLRTMQILDEGHWIDLISNARTDEGRKRVYRRMCRENPKGPPYGMRIITVHCEHLGRLKEKNGRRLYE